MKKSNIGRIALFLLGCLAIGVFVNYVIIKNILALRGLAYIAVITLSAAMCGLIIYLMTFLVIKENKPKPPPGRAFYEFTAGGGAEALIDKINGHIFKIKQLNGYISDKAVSSELAGIEKNIGKIQTQLRDEKISANRINQLDEFFDYYMPLTVKITDSYRRIETNELTGKNATETKKEVSAILPLINKALEKELDYMFTDEMLDITTDIRMLESMLSKDGLLDKIKGDEI